MIISVDYRELREIMRAFGGVFMGVAAALNEAHQPWKKAYSEAEKLADKLAEQEKDLCVDHQVPYMGIMSAQTRITSNTWSVLYWSHSGKLYIITHPFNNDELGYYNITFEYPDDSAIREHFEDIHQKWASIRSIEEAKRMAEEAKYAHEPVPTKARKVVVEEEEEDYA